MAQKKPALPRRAWRLLRLALLWARKGGAFRQGLALNLRLLPGYLRSLKPGHGRANRLDHMNGEREFSFDETPAFHFKMHRPASMRLPRIPCITPADDFLDDVDVDHRLFFGRGGDGGSASSFQDDYDEAGYDHEEDAGAVSGAGDDNYDDQVDDDEDNGYSQGCGDLIEVEEAQGIDSKAEEFIAKFYEQMRLQRQVSLLEYNEMLHRGMS